MPSILLIYLFYRHMNCVLRKIPCQNFCIWNMVLICVSSIFREIICVGIRKFSRALNYAKKVWLLWTWLASQIWNTFLHHKLNINIVYLLSFCLLIHSLGSKYKKAGICLPYLSFYNQCISLCQFQPLCIINVYRTNKYMNV